MKRIGILVLALMLAALPAAGAERGLEADFAADSPEAALCAVVAEKTGLPLETAGEEPGSAANRMLADPGRIVCGTQQVLIEGLQGYTTADLRQAMTPVCRVAVSPLYLVMDRSAAEAYGISSLETLQQYTAEHEYELTFARHLGADPADRAAVRLADEAAALTDYFREEEIPDVLRSGDADAAVFSGRDLAENDGDWLVLCCLSAERSRDYPDVPCAAEAGWTPCEGVWFALFASADAPEEEIGSVAEAARAIAQEDLPAGWELSPLEGGECREAVRELFADYKAYMTAEGLFFYEE